MNEQVQELMRQIAEIPVTQETFWQRQEITKALGEYGVWMAKDEHGVFRWRNDEEWLQPVSPHGSVRAKSKE